MSLTNVLVAINVVAFLWQMNTFGGVDYDHGYLYGPAVVQQGQWWRIFTAAFLHGSVPHVLLNMIALFQVGNIVETMFGKVRFALLYLLAIVGSGAAVLYFNYGIPTLGASGAIFGLFGALVAVGLRLGPRGRALIGQVIPIIAINLLFTFSVPGISAAAHVGGLVTGFLAGLLLYMVRPQRAAYAYAYVPGNESGAPEQQAPVTYAHDPAAVETYEYEPPVETIDDPPHAGAHEDPEAPPPHLRDPQQ